MAEGLAQLHALGFVHRDVSTDNVVAAADGRWKVVDFAKVQTHRAFASTAPLDELAV